MLDRRALDEYTVLTSAELPRLEAGDVFDALEWNELAPREIKELEHPTGQAQRFACWLVGQAHCPALTVLNGIHNAFTEPVVIVGCDSETNGDLRVWLDIMTNGPASQVRQ